MSSDDAPNVMEASVPLVSDCTACWISRTSGFPVVLPCMAVMSGASTVAPAATVIGCSSQGLEPVPGRVGEVHGGAGRMAGENTVHGPERDRHGVRAGAGDVGDGYVFAVDLQQQRHRPGGPGVPGDTHRQV